MASYRNFDFVVAGATGWIGRATIDYLFRQLGDATSQQVHAFASRAGELTLQNGRKLPVSALTDLPASQTTRSTIVFHYAFRTKDKVGDMSLADYVASNQNIRDILLRFVDSHDVTGIFLPSSGAAYAGLDADNHSDGAVYGRCKLDDERIFREAAAAKGVKLCASRVFNLSGAYINKHQLYALSSIILSCLQKQPVRIHASHPVWRSYYAVEDLIRLATASLMDPSATSALATLFDTVGTEVIEVGELAQRCKYLLSAPDIVVERPYIVSNPNNYYVGTPDALRDLERRYNLVPRSLDQQILDTADYLRSFKGQIVND